MITIIAIVLIVIGIPITYAVLRSIAIGFDAAQLEFRNNTNKKKYCIECKFYDSDGWVSDDWVSDGRPDPQWRHRTDRHLASATALALGHRRWRWTYPSHPGCRLVAIGNPQTNVNHKYDCTLWKKK